MGLKKTLAKMKLAKTATKKRGRPRGKVRMKRPITGILGRLKGTQVLACSQCADDVICSPYASAVICSSCVAKSVAPPEFKKVKPKGTGTGKRGRPRIHPIKVPSGFPRGWHFKKKYVHTDGSVWSRGKRVETKLVKKLKKRAAAVKEL